MSEPHFDRCQFDRPTGKGHSNSRAVDDAVVLFDPDLFGNSLGVAEEDLANLVIGTRRQCPHHGTAWARDNKKVLRLLRRVFPHVWVADRPMRVRYGFHSAARWFEVIRLYFATGWDAKSVSERLDCTQNAVEMVIKRVKWARRGLTDHGKSRHDHPVPKDVGVGLR